MKNKNFVKLIRFFVVSIFLIIFIVCLSSCKKNYEWIPSVQGSNVSEIPFEEIGDSHIVEKFANYSSFSKSKFANYYFCSQAKAKEERYSKEFFKNFDLITIKFNMPEKGIDFTVIDVCIVDNICTVVLLPVKRIAKITQQTTTYCCFVETAVDVSELRVELKFEETILHESQSFSYITSSNEFYSFEDKLKPRIFVINNKNGIEQFIEYDEVLSKQTYVYGQLSRYNDDVFESYSLMLVRLFSSDFENLAVSFDDDKLNIVGTYSNHYLFENEMPHHKLVVLLVPKEIKINEISRTVYFEYEDNLETKSTVDKFLYSEQSDIAENVIMYSFMHENDWGKKFNKGI